MKKKIAVTLVLFLLCAANIRAQKYDVIKDLLQRNTVHYDSIILTGMNIMKHDALSFIEGFGIKGDSCMRISFDSDVLGKRKTKITGIRITPETDRQTIDTIRSIRFSTITELNTDSVRYLGNTDRYIGATYILFMVKNGMFSYIDSDEPFVYQQSDPTADRQKFIDIITTVRTSTEK